MNFKLASTIYSMPWLITSQAALAYLHELEKVKAGQAEFPKPEPFALPVSAVKPEVIVAPTDKWAAKEHPGYEGKTIAVMPVMGPLMMDDYCGAFGTESMRAELERINATESIRTILFIFGTPGGAVPGTELFANAIKNSPKETIGNIRAICGSAGYWLASSCDRIEASSQTDLIGSIGTMISFVDRSAYMEEQGIILREYTATASKDKNKAFNEAVKGDGKLLVQEMLNPMNDIFIAAVRANRGEKLNEKETLSGKVFLTQKAIEFGLVDAYSPLDKTISNLLKKHTKNSVYMTIKWPKLLAFLGKASSAEKVEMTDEHLDKVEASIKELEEVKAKVTELETAATASASTITGLQSQVTALTTERDNLKTENTNLKAEVAKLGGKDGGEFTTVKGEGDKFKKEEKEVEATEMSFQKDLYNKL